MDRMKALALLCDDLLNRVKVLEQVIIIHRKRADEFKDELDALRDEVRGV